MALKNTRLLVRDAVFSTVFVYACIALFAANPFNFKMFNLIGSSLHDIEFTDIIFTGKNQRKVDYQAKISNDIVLVNAADRNRAEIAALLNRINEEHPAVVGVDFIFEGPKDAYSDSLLKAAFDHTKKLVLATKFKNTDESNRTTYIRSSPTLGEHPEGFANLMINSMEKTVRDFRPVDKNGQQEVHSFALEVVRRYDPKMAEKFLERHREFELINYDGNLNSIHHFNGLDIENGNFPEGFLKDKIVLLGFFGSDCHSSPVLDDFFYTPMNEKLMGRKFPDTYGVTIQANIVNMILQDKPINKTPAWVDWILGFFICLLHNFIFIRHYVHKHLWYHFYAKMIQFVSSLLLIFLCIYLFRNYHIKMSVSPYILPVLLTVDLLYFYDTLLKWMHKRFNTATYFLTGPMHH